MSTRSRARPWFRDSLVVWPVSPGELEAVDEHLLALFDRVAITYPRVQFDVMNGVPSAAGAFRVPDMEG